MVIFSRVGLEFENEREILRPCIPEKWYLCNLKLRKYKTEVTEVTGNLLTYNLCL